MSWFLDLLGYHPILGPIVNAERGRQRAESDLNQQRQDRQFFMNEFNNLRNNPTPPPQIGVPRWGVTPDSPGIPIPPGVNRGQMPGFGGPPPYENVRPGESIPMQNMPPVKRAAQMPPPWAQSGSASPPGRLTPTMDPGMGVTGGVTPLDIPPGFGAGPGRGVPRLGGQGWPNGGVARPTAAPGPMGAPVPPPPMWSANPPGAPMPGPGNGPFMALGGPATAPVAMNPTLLALMEEERKRALLGGYNNANSGFMFG